MPSPRNQLLPVVGGVAVGIAMALGLQKIFGGSKTSTLVDLPIAKAPEPRRREINDKQLHAAFLEVFESLQEDILKDLPQELPQIQFDYFRKLIPYTCMDGKMNRGLAAVKTFLIVKDFKYTDEEFRKACILGWCIEILQAYFLVEDDIMDRSEMRRGKVCWYKLPEVGLMAINDGLLLEAMIYRLTKLYFANDASYMHINDVFHEVTYLTELGQMLDMITEQHYPDIDFDLFTLDRHQKIVIYKTAFYSFYLPIAVGLIHAGIFPSEQPEVFRVTKDICNQMGEYFQIQDDFLDCFGTYDQIGKVGKDIEDAKCSWMVIQALKRVSPEQKEVLVQSYGQNVPEEVAKIKALYDEIGLKQVYADYEKAVVADIKQKIGTIDSLPQEIFTHFLSKIEGRNK